MAELLLHNKPVATVFDLLGQKENDMTDIDLLLTSDTITAALKATKERRAS